MEAQGEMLKKTGWQRGAAVLLGAGILLDLAVRGSGWFLIHVSEFYMTALGGAAFLLQIVSMLLSAWISGSPKDGIREEEIPDLQEDIDTARRMVWSAYGQEGKYD